MTRRSTRPGNADSPTPEETIRALRNAEDHLVDVHAGLIDDPGNSVEGLDRAACSGHITELARLAFGAASQGVTERQWRSWILDGLREGQGPGLLAAAEDCMRTNGLWPWHSGEDRG